MKGRTFTLRIYAFAVSIACVIVMIYLLAQSIVYGGYFAVGVLWEAPYEILMLAIGLAVIVALFVHDLKAYKRE